MPSLAKDGLGSFSMVVCLLLSIKILNKRLSVLGQQAVFPRHTPCCFSIVNSGEQFGCSQKQLAWVHTWGSSGMLFWPLTVGAIFIDGTCLCIVGFGLPQLPSPTLIFTSQAAAALWHWLLFFIPSQFLDLSISSRHVSALWLSCKSCYPVPKQRNGQLAYYWRKKNLL